MEKRLWTQEAGSRKRAVKGSNFDVLLSSFILYTNTKIISSAKMDFHTNNLVYDTNDLPAKNFSFDRLVILLILGAKDKQIDQYYEDWEKSGSQLVEFMSFHGIKLLHCDLSL